MGMYACRAHDGAEQGEWLQGGGWRAWIASNARVPTPKEARGEIDRLRAELRGDFRSALRHAYLGPRLANAWHITQAPPAVLLQGGQKPAEDCHVMPA